MPSNVSVGEAAPTRSALARLRTEAGYGLLVIIGGVAISAGASVLIAKMLSAEQFGIYIFAITLLNYGVVIARGGMDSATVRYVNQYRAQGTGQLVLAFVQWSHRSMLHVSILVALAGAAAAIFAGHFFPNIDVTALLVAAAGMIPLSLVFLHSALLRAEKRIVHSQLSLRVLRPLLGAVFATVVWTFGLASGAAVALAEVAGLLLLVFPLARLTRHLRPTHVPLVSASHHGEWTATARGMTIAHVSQQLIGQADVLMVGVCFGMVEAGVYGLASRLGKLVVLGNRAAHSIAEPLIAEAYHGGQRTLLQAVVSQTCTLVAIATLFMALSLWLIPSSVFAWLGPEFSASRHVLFILLFGQVVNATTGPVGTILLMTGNQRAQTFVNSTFGLSLAAGILITAILDGSIIGVAVLFSFATALSNLTKALIVYSRTGVISMPLLDSAKYVAAAVRTRGAKP